MGTLLSTDLSDPAAVPYFLWDDPMTVEEFKTLLKSASAAEQARLLGKLLREARDCDVWKFVSPRDVVGRWQEIEPHLGRRRGAALPGFYLRHRETHDLDLPQSGAIQQPTIVSRDVQLFIKSADRCSCSSRLHRRAVNAMSAYRAASSAVPHPEVPLAD